MGEKREQDWEPRSEAVMRDQRAAYDAMRERCPSLLATICNGRCSGTRMWFEC
jgi:hypothetical protein